MDKIINAHIDTLEDFELEIERVIAQEISQIDIEELVRNPNATLTQVADNVKRVFLDEYVDEILKEGIDLTKIIEKKIESEKALKIDDSNDPNLNQDGKSNN